MPWLSVVVRGLYTFDMKGPLVHEIQGLVPLAKTVIVKILFLQSISAFSCFRCSFDTETSRRAANNIPALIALTFTDRARLQERLVA